MSIKLCRHDFYWNLRQGKKAKIGMACVGVCFLLLVLMGPVLHMFYVNHTASAPRGLYLALPVEPSYGDYVNVSCPEDVPPLAEKGELLLKRLRGLPGDVYVVNDDALFLNGEYYPLFRAKYLPMLPKGTYTVPDGYYFLLNDHPRSFDSRYLGPIAREQVHSKMILLLDYDSVEKIYEELGGPKT